MSTAFNITPDRVGVFNSDFQQVFPFARPVDARVAERSKLLDHTIETGQIITDYSIVLPIEVEISFIVGSVFYQEMYQQIRSLYKNKQLLTVQTLTAPYPNMVIAEMPHDEKADIYDALPIRVLFRQIQFVPNPSTYAPADPTQTDTKALGQQNTYPVANLSPDGLTVPATPSYSSVPPSATMQGTSFLTGATPTVESPSPTSPQTVTTQNSIASSFGGGVVPIGSNN